MSTKAAQMNKLLLNANFRPMISAVNPHTAAPNSSPTCDASATPAIFLTGLPNSWSTAGCAID